MLKYLDQAWTLEPVSGPVPPDIAAAGPVPASVPGTVHTDLLAAGQIPDPYLDDNERRLAWIGSTDWRYQTSFDWAPDGHDRADLVFEGLDTVAQVALNGQVVHSSSNMHRTYRVDVTETLRPGTNQLSVTFFSAVRYADGNNLALGARPHVNHHPFNAIRKMACNFGWDWGPDLVTAGIWRPVSLHSWITARFASVRPVVDVSGNRGTVEVHIDVERSGDAAPLVVTATVGDAQASARIDPGQTRTVVPLVVEGVDLWWPRGHGAQPLYDLTVTLQVAEGGDDQLDAWSSRIGFRTVRLVSEPDEQGTGFGFVVNDRPVFVKGANWIPDDVFPHRVTRQRYAERLHQAEEAGINLLRVWGGGIFEADDFYTECDERGLMTWQDFLFACAAYAEEEPLRSEVVAEARDNVTRLMPHPSLVLWNGCNENIWGHVDWGWQDQLDSKTWGLAYYADVLPAIVAELDPGRPYTPGSPWSPDPALHPNDPAHGTMHIWDVWNQVDYQVYRSYQPRFVSEFGWQGPPTWSTLRRAVSDDPLTPESPGMLVHQKAQDGHTKLTRGLVRHLPVPDDMDAWHWAMSLNQARAVRTGVEYFRSLSPRCTGSVAWQLNDCWPVTSWAAIDGDGRRKPLFYALRHAHADRLVTLQPTGEDLSVVLVNDTPENWTGTLTLALRSFDGSVLQQQEQAVDVPAWSAGRTWVSSPLATPSAPGRALLEARVGDQRALWFFTEDRDSDLVAPDFETKAAKTATGFEVTLTARTLLRDVALLVDKIDPDAIVSDMLT